MKILSAKQTRELDRYTLAETSVASIDLMERACRAFTTWFVQHFHGRERVGFVCGTGNNGGDGLGIARMLIEQGYTAVCWIIKGSMPVTPDFEVNLERAVAAGVKVFEVSAESEEVLAESDVIVDALFGSGLTRPAEGLYAWAIERMNVVRACRVAVDIPSGLMADSPSEGVVVKADYTITFQLPKLAFFLPQNAPFTGQWHVVEIGLSRQFIKNSETNYNYTREKSVRRLLRKRGKFDHKGVYGHALVIAGSLGKMGAAVLSARACLRSGVGLLTVHTPGCGNVIIQTSVPEAMASVDRDEGIFSSPPALENYQALGIGPGLGQRNETALALEFVLRHYRRPMVVDADALNIISDRRELLPLMPEGSILTPHPKEFERLAGKAANDFDRLDTLCALARQTRCFIVLKGAYSAIAEPDGTIHFNSSGNPGMATGGSGDVLTGIITGLLAQQYSPANAARIGVYLHGLAGDLAAAELGENSLTASDIVNYLPAAFLRLTRK